MHKMYKILLVTFLMVTSALYGQRYTISGSVTSADTDEPLVGANVYVKGTTIGAASEMDGNYSINAPAGEHTLVCSYIGFETVEYQVDLTGDMEVNFELREYQFSLNVTVVADRAKERETPVAFTNVDKKDMELRLGSRDIPLVLNTTPSVYSTQQGGGAGDARVNVRGFSQENVAIMINGVPVNDMENGWVYWSNWDGVGDATSSIQLQRGLSAVNLATPSIGGSMNILTDPAAQKFGIMGKQEFGNDGFMKTTVSAHSGLINGKFAFSAAGVKKIGNGIYDGTWTDAYAYYFGSSWQINKTNRLELYALGAPQRHGQNLYRQNIAVYDHEYASELTREVNSTTEVFEYDATSLAAIGEEGRRYNENYNTVSSSYTGQQYWGGGASERYDPEFINERENYYHKPQVNLNWFTQLTDFLSLYTIAYYSGGTGGGTGTYGDLVWDYSRFSRVADWNKTIAVNKGTVDRKGNAKTAGESYGILRNSTNNQWTIGAISKAYIKVTDYLKTSVGVDWRTAEIDHFREVRDLLGGQYFTFTGNEFDSPAQQKKKLGDKIDYHFTNTVDWLGFYGQAEYSQGNVTAYGMYGYSMIKYTYTNHFVKNASGGELYAETDNITGFQAKGGASYRLSTDFSIFGNAGYVSKVPIFDNVISDRNGTVADDPENEKFLSFEAGFVYNMMGGMLNLKGNYYNTSWQDRANSIGVQNADGSDGLVFLRGMDQLHSGFEFEAAFQPISLFRVDGAASFGSWRYTDNVQGTYVADYQTGEEVDFDYYVEDLKVGNQPQTQLAASLSLFPVRGMTAQLVFKYFDDHYADWSPFDRTDPTDNAQPWMAPAYTLFDFHFAYNLPFNLKGVDFTLFAHVFNLLDEVYIQDALDNSPYNAYTANGKNHHADDAEVFLGLPRTFNVGVSIAY
ncbi:MAG: TonB-dependent receptor [Melioribacteraceae bacterium]|nr:TonB-dependent receptor [Melioribacteraceae bacterium]MCF8355669.1 TonB-dependent receptor [Melioribacteraceae bacterium]MCF8395129.1 TonB-dependent receptor [Melioribacteraceae bacterium]MCF8420576.1 TonB-dependent receptor [Melioribacteraceae bacterium]